MYNNIINMDNISIIISIIGIIIAFISCHSSMKQYRSQIKPYFFAGSIKFNGNPANKVEFSILNDGAPGIIHQIKPLSKNIEKIIYTNANYDIKKDDDPFNIEVLLKDKIKQETCNIKIKIKYTDREYNHYTATCCYRNNKLILKDQNRFLI